MRHVFFVGLLATLLAGLLSATAAAQYPIGANALYWTSDSGTAGPFCWGFSCTPVQATITAGEKGELTVRGEPRQPYILFFSASATSCVSGPKWFNSLVLDDPIFVLHAGVVSDLSGILACPHATDTLPVTVPNGVPAGLEISIQAVVGVPIGPGFPPWSFSQAITFTTI